MCSSRTLVKVVGSSCLLIMLVEGWVAAQQLTEYQTAEQAYKNIQVLKGTPANQLILSMHLMVGQLGEDCVFCHTDHNPANFPRDDKPAKQTARRMIEMVRNINRTAFEGRQVVTCYTCHQGNARPVNVLRLPLTKAIEEEHPASSSLPTADQVIEKYKNALGGEAAIRLVESRLVIATQDLPTGPGGKVPLQAQVERFVMAPNLSLTSFSSATGAQSEGFDGQTAWGRNAGGVVSDRPSVDQQRAKRGADMLGNLGLGQEYTRMEVVGREPIEGRDAYRVIGYPEGDSPEQLYFDANSGLLLRRATSLPTPLGDTPFQVDYADYRDTGSGVKMPFLIQMTPASARSEPQTHSTFRVQRVQDNPPIESRKFARP